MRFAKFGLGMTIALSLLSACQEPQLAPELPERPSSAFKVTEIHTGLSNPWSVAEMPDGGFLITEKSGKLLHVTAQGTSIEINGLPDDIYAKGQGGLLDIVLAPDFAVTQEVYLSYSYGSDDANGTALLRAKLLSGVPVSYTHLTLPTKRIV